MLKNLFILTVILLGFVSYVAEAQIKPAQSQYLEQIGAFVNPSFEQGYKGWTDNGTCTRSLETNIPFLNKSYKLSCASQNVELKQEITSLASFSGLKYVASCYLSASGADLTVRLLKDGLVEKETVITDGSSEFLEVRGDIGATSNGIQLEAANVSATYYVDDCSMKIDKSVFATGSDGDFLVFDSSVPRGVKASSALTGTLNPITDWEDFNPDITGWTSGFTSEGSKRRVGSNLEIRIQVSLTATPAGGNFIFNLPDGLEIDVAAFKGFNARKNAGYFFIWDSSAAARQGRVRVNTATNFTLTNDSGSTMASLVNPTSPITFVSGDSVDIYIDVPILGWTSGLDAAVQNVQTTANQAGEIVWLAGDIANTEDLVKADGSCYLEADYPDFIANTGSDTYGDCTITTSGDGFRVPDLVTDNRFIRAAGGSLAVGTTQTDTTAVNGLSANQAGHYHLQGESGVAVNGDINYHRYGVTNVGVSKNRPGGTTGTGVNAARTNTVDPAITVSSTQSETRPNNMALVPYVRLRNISKVIAGVFEQIGDTELIQFEGRGNGAQSITANSTSLTFNEVKDPYGIWAGNNIATAPRDGTWIISGAVYISAPQSDFAVYIYENGSTQVKICGYQASSSRAAPFECIIDVTAGNTYAIKINKTAIHTNNSVLHHLYVQEIPNKEAIVKNLAADMAVNCQTKTLSADKASTGVMSDLTFSNLTVGRKYRLRMYARERSTGAGRSTMVISFQDSAPSAVMDNFRTGNYYTVANQDSWTTFSPKIYTATDSTLQVNLAARTLANLLTGTYLEVCELPSTYVDTTQL